MCTLALYFRIFPEYPIVIAANRDESLSRPSAEPIRLWTTPWVYGGQDLLAGGTWLGVNAHGVAVGVLNRHSLTPPDPKRRSRGHLCLDALKYPSAEAAVAALMTWKHEKYNLFNLVIVDYTATYVLNNQDDHVTVCELPPGFRLVTNRDPNDPSCPRVARFASVFTEISQASLNGAFSLSDLSSALRRPMADHANNTLGETREGLCLHLDGYGTCSSTLLAYSRQERRYHYLFAPGPPCRVHYKEVSLPSATFANHPPSTI